MPPLWGPGVSGRSNIEYTPQYDSSDKSSSECDITWSPGDGVCPTRADFNHCCQLKVEDWKNTALTYLEGTESFQYYLEAFLGLLENVPPFYYCPRGPVNISDRPKSFLILKTKEKTQLKAAIPVRTKSLRSGYFTSIMEILQQAGEKSQILHEPGIQIENSFWDIATQGYWVARVEKFKGVFYSPWMLRREYTKKKRSFQLTSLRRGDWEPVISNSSLAFEILLGFCLLEGLEGEFLTGFASVLMLTSRHAPPPKFSPPIMILTAPMRSSPRPKDMDLLQLFRSTEKCISLSPTQDALDSLLCSTFFDPCVPCNFAGAASLGVRKALSTVDKIDNRQLLSVVTNVKPYLSLLWASAVCNDRVTSFLNMALRSLRPICLVAAFWTNTAQSFHQIAYSVQESESIISRALEFQTSYFSRPEFQQALPYPEQYIADEQSGFATSRLFNWHRDYDDGIWLDDGQRDIEFVRRLQMHPWIIDPFDSQDDEPVEEPKCHDHCVERILQWNREVEKYRRAGVDTP
ncbi:hypothetical protein BDV27DRAFT_168509 [Aspergillus caelatus]|uniref:Uncharacterized protein n=1 Tax=Aspergillus caelatus TaxID=61420 RepID=A0A5N7AER2_9EURO|nr:uncharacterized protein BDV27DRAFT_168509 [Aspergillus caelatus]KAE8368153.1 hypothetical protein BDV27DRAFT_168509 [Aspergillus caelatus]